MPPLSDRQRIELAIPAYLILTLTGAPGMFVPADPALIRHAEARVGALRQDLRVASLEPFADLAPKKQGALIRRLERIAKTVIALWEEVGLDLPARLEGLRHAGLEDADDAATLGPVEA